MALVDVIRADELDRLRVCAADDCEDVVVDLSKNRSKRFCDGGCGNRANVAAYRARKAGRLTGRGPDQSGGQSAGVAQAWPSNRLVTEPSSKTSWIARLISGAIDSTVSLSNSRSPRRSAACR